jgi:DNA-binding transcriptional regulator YhcF (GntR family)
MAVLKLGRGRYEWGTVALLLLSRCAADWLADGVIRRPVRITHSLSIRAIAQSLGAPYASIHRYVMALQEQGLIVEAGRGVAISNDPAVAPAVVAFLAEAHDRFIRLIEDIGPELEIAGPSSEPQRGLVAATLHAALDIWLVPYEIAREPVVDWTSKLVWIVIVVANVRHVTTDDDLSRTYAYKPTPDSLREPIGVRAIAAITGLSYGTAFRHCQKLAQQDVIRYERGGWLLASRKLADDTVDSGVRALLAYYAKRISELVALALSIQDVGKFYLGRRPDYVSLAVMADAKKGCQPVG